MAGRKFCGDRFGGVATDRGETAASLYFATEDGARYVSSDFEKTGAAESALSKTISFFALLILRDTASSGPLGALPESEVSGLELSSSSANAVCETKTLRKPKIKNVIKNCFIMTPRLSGTSIG